MATLASRPQLNHMGIHVWDMLRMEAFYTEVFDLIVTDRGNAIAFPYQLVFMSGSTNQHHQFVIASGRPPEATKSTILQISFKLDSLDDMREIRKRSLERGATGMRGLNHGNAWSSYFLDPEGNQIEVYMDTPFHVPQPHGDELDLSKSDMVILAETERNVRNDPGFMSIAEFEAQMAAKLT